LLFIYFIIYFDYYKYVDISIILILTLGNKLPQDVLNPAHGIISKGERSFP